MISEPPYAFRWALDSEVEPDFKMIARTPRETPAAHRSRRRALRKDIAARLAPWLPSYHIFHAAMPRVDGITLSDDDE